MKSAKFKDSPLGPIPQDWEVKRLGDLCEKIGSGATPLGGASSYCQTGIALIRSQNVVDTRFSFDGLAYINSDQADELTNVEVLSKDVLLNITGDSVARVCTVPDSALPARVNQHVCILRTIAKKCHYLYLAYRLVVEKKRLLAAAFGGGTRNALTKADVEAFTIPCPPLPEQQRIAEALGEVDKLIESLDEQIEKKRLIARGVAHDLLSGKKRLPGFKGEWREVAFKAAFISLGNNTYARECLCGDSANAYDIHYGDVLIRFGAVVDFSSDYIPRLKDGIKPNKDFLQDGDIVFADTAEDEMVGKAVEIRGLGDYKAVSGLHTMACRPRADMFAPRFLGYYLNSDSYRKQLLPLITGSKVSSLSRANFESTTLTMPDVSEQQAIADLLGEQDAAIAALEGKREKYVRIKEGMMRDLLSGKVRMKGE